ncbi:MAG: hypothetical protein D6705_01185 [Deltaproteobacteria bacterium]|nr:MAG: hypothetical protein D6705_01185 [Deltaproteobacteria bacterium]
MRSLQLATCLLASGVVASAPVLAHAAPSPSASASAKVGGGSGAFRGKIPRIRIHADTDFFGWTHVDDEGPGPDDPDVNVVGFGFGRPTLTDSGLCGGACLLSVRPIWGLGLGVVLLSGQIVVGTRFSFTVDGIYDDDDNDDDATHLVAGQFVPYFRWIFLPGKRVRPYVELRFGLGGGTMVQNEPGNVPDTKITTNIVYPTVGAGGGAHIFLVDALSVDVGLNVDYAAPHGRTLVDPDPPGGNDEEYDPIANVVNLGILLGLSVWFGDGT